MLKRILRLLVVIGILGISIIPAIPIQAADPVWGISPVINNGYPYLTSLHTVTPSVTTNAATSLTPTTATLNGDLTDMGDDTNVACYFEWGLTDTYGNTAGYPFFLQAPGIFSTTIMSLTPSTTYHYRALGVGNFAGYGNDVEFTTSALPAPSVTTNTATSVTSTTAALNGNLTSMGSDTNVACYFEWGTNTNYGNTMTPQWRQTIGTFTYTITNLTPSTTYHYRALGVGNFAGYGNDVEFTTAAPAIPTVTTNAATSITPSSATLNGYLTNMGVDTNVACYFEWGINTSYGNTAGFPFWRQTIGAFNTTITNLSPGTTYHYRALGVGNNAGYGNDVQFTTTTGTLPTVTTGDTVYLSSTSVGLYGTLDTMGTASSVTVGFNVGNSNPPSTYYAAYNSPFNATGTFYVALAGLTAGTQYYYQATATGNGVANGIIRTFTTASTPLTNSVVQILAATDITNTTATLNGRLVSAGTAFPPTIGEFTLYAGAPNVFTSYKVNVTAAGDYLANATALEPGTLYTYRFKVYDDWYANPYNALWIASLEITNPTELLKHCQTSVSTIFTTTGISTTTLGVDTVQMLTADSDINTHISNLKGILTGMGGNPSVKVFFNWGPGAKGTSGYSYTTTGQNVTIANYFNEFVTVTTGAGVYHYRAGATAGNVTVYGEDLEFNTYGTTPPPTTPLPTGTGVPSPFIPDTSTPEGRWLTIIYLMVAAPLLLTICLHKVPLIAISLSVAVDVLILGWGIINWLATTSTFIVLLVVLGLVAAFAIFTFIGLRRGSG